MAHAFWAGEFLRAYIFIVVTLVGSRLVLVASGEGAGGQSNDFLFGWTVRLGVTWLAASALGYL